MNIHELVLGAKLTWMSLHYCTSSRWLLSVLLPIKSLHRKESYHRVYRMLAHWSNADHFTCRQELLAQYLKFVQLERFQDWPRLEQQLLARENKIVVIRPLLRQWWGSVKRLCFLFLGQVFQPTTEIHRMSIQFHCLLQICPRFKSRLWGSQSSRPFWPYYCFLLFALQKQSSWKLGFGQKLPIFDQEHRSLSWCERYGNSLCINHGSPRYVWTMEVRDMSN